MSNSEPKDDTILELHPMDWLDYRMAKHDRAANIRGRFTRALRRARAQRPIRVQRYGGRRG